MIDRHRSAAGDHYVTPAGRGHAACAWHEEEELEPSALRACGHGRFAVAASPVATTHTTHRHRLCLLVLPDDASPPFARPLQGKKTASCRARAALSWPLAAPSLMAQTGSGERPIGTAAVGQPLRIFRRGSQRVILTIFLPHSSKYITIRRLMQCYVNFFMMWRKERARGEKEVVTSQNNHRMRQLTSCCCHV